MIDFTEEELQRYSRHILLQEVGAEGQERIRRGRVLVIGVGGLGSPVALYLAAAGVGTIGIADGDHQVSYQRRLRPGKQTFYPGGNPAFRRTDLHPSSGHGLLPVPVR